MFCKTLRFSWIYVLKSYVPGLKSWRGGQVNVTLFFYTTHKQVLQIVPMLNQSYEIIMRTSLNHDCCTCFGPCMIFFFFGGGGRGGKGVYPDRQSMDGWHERWPFCRLPVANSIMTLSKEPYRWKLQYLPYQSICGCYIFFFVVALYSVLIRNNKRTWF